MIELKYVHHRYPASNALLYVKNVTIRTGEVVGILGENGSGKTTLLKAVMGIGGIQTGEVRIDGKPPTEQYARMAFVTEEGSFLPNLTPKKYGELLADYFPRFDQALYVKLLLDHGLPTDRRIRTFSKGQKISLELCAGLAKRADYLIMDEPFVGKDIFARRDSLKRMIAGLTGEETVLVSTHLIDEIENVIDRAIILHKGLVRADIYVDDMRDRGFRLEDVMREAQLAHDMRPFRWPEG